MLRFAPVRMFALVFALAGVVPSCSGEAEVDPTELAKELEKSLKSARVHLADGRLEKAGMIYKKVLKNDPENAEAIYGMGRIRFSEGNNDKAVELIQKAAAAKADQHEYHFWLGEVQKARESFGDAATAYGKAFELDPENGEYGLAYGKMLKKAKQFDAAEPVLRQVIELDEQAEYVYTELGDVLRELGKSDEALRTYMKAQTVHPGDLMAHAGAALVYEDKGDKKHALDEWSAYVRMDCCSHYSKTVARKKVAELNGGTLPEDTPPADKNEG